MEGNAGTVDMIFNVSLSKVSSRNTTVTWTASTESGNNATLGTDYAVAPNSHTGTASISAGSMTTTIRVPIAGDILIEDNETFTVTLTNPTGGADIDSTKATAVGTITNDDFAPIISVSNTSITVGEGDSNVSIATTLDKVTAQPVTVRYSTAADSALAGSDFIAQNNRTHTIPALTTADSFTIPIVDDEIYEANESFTVTLSSPSVAVFDGSATNIVVTITITDDDLPTLSFESADFSPTEEVGNFVVDVMLSSPAKESISFDVAVGGGTATKGTNQDYTDPDLANQRITIAIGSSRGSITIPILNDTEIESTESFILTLSNLSGAKFANGQSSLLKTIFILDNDSTDPVTPILTVSGTNLSVAEDVLGGNIEVGIELSNTSSTDITFEVAVSDGPIPDDSTKRDSTKRDATKDEDYKDPTSATSESSSGQTVLKQTINAGSIESAIIIPILNDLKNEGDETFTLTLSELTGANFASGTESKIEITIIDNDKPILTFANSSVEVDETDANKNVELTLNLSNPTSSPVDIYYSTLSETAYAGLDFTSKTNEKVTIAAGKNSISFSIEVIGDTENEGNETFKVVVSTPPLNAVFAAGVRALEATITITDDEGPILSVDSSTLIISEKAGNTKIGLKLSGPSSSDVVVSYMTSIEGTDNTESGDFTPTAPGTPGTVTIASGSTSGFIEIPIINDEISEDFETFTITLSAVTEAVFAGSQDIVVQVTIVDDEALPILTIGSATASEANRAAEIPLSLDKASEDDVTITFFTTEETATEGLDYTKQTNVTYTISSGTTGKIRVPVIDDNIYEGDTHERFNVTITEISGAAYGEGIINTPIPISIDDNDVKPTLLYFNESM